MATEAKAPVRNVSVVITIVIDSIPLDKVQELEEKAFQVGDEWGARVNTSKSEARTISGQK